MPYSEHFGARRSAVYRTLQSQKECRIANNSGPEGVPYSEHFGARRSPYSGMFAILKVMRTSVFFKLIT